MAVNPLIVDDKPARVPQVVLVHEVLVCHWTAFAIDILSPLKEVRFLDKNVAATPS